MIQKFDLFEKKKNVVKGKRKPEKQQIEDKYKEYIDKIEDKRKELQKINLSDDPESIKHARAVIKRIEIEMSEKELDIIKLRDKKLVWKKQLKLEEQFQKDKKKS